MAQEMAAKMTPEQQRNMAQMAANMDPAVMRQMQAQMMGGGGMFGGPATTAAVPQAAPALSAITQAAEVNKKRGNDLHRAGQYTEAVDAYTAAADSLAGV